MTPEIVFIYDGECPFCNKFAELLELKSNLPEVSIINGRKDIPRLESLYKQGYDLNNGAILIKGNKILHGANAINYICSEIKSPSDSLLQILAMTFSSSKCINLFFPILIWSRRIILFLKRVPRQVIIE